MEGLILAVSKMEAGGNDEILGYSRDENEMNQDEQRRVDEFNAALDWVRAMLDYREAKRRAKP
jgi:hypothetical protein